MTAAPSCGDVEEGGEKQTMTTLTAALHMLTYTPHPAACLISNDGYNE